MTAVMGSGEPGQNGAEANALTPQLADSLKIPKAEDASFHSAHTLLGRKHSIAGVLDGHGGPAASRHCQRCLAKYIEELVEGGASLEDACTRSFERCHSELRSSGTTAGTTATLFVVDHEARQLLCCNVGDSHAVLVTASGVSRLTVDHRLQHNLQEQERVRKAGGQLAFARHPTEGHPTGPVRMWPGGLAVSRSIGDADCGDMVICEPALSRHDVPAAGAAVVVCSDGVWDALGEEEVAAIVRHAADPARSLRGLRSQKKKGVAPMTAKLVAEAVTRAALRERGLLDDVTCVVALMGLADAGAAAAAPAAASMPLAPQVIEEVLEPTTCCGLFRLSRGGASNRTVIPDYTVKGGLRFEDKTFKGLRILGMELSFSKRFPAQPTAAAAPPTAAVADDDSTDNASSSDASAITKEGAGPVVLGPVPPGTRRYNFEDLGDHGLANMTYLGSGEFCSVFATVINGQACAVKMLKGKHYNSATARRDLEFETQLLVRMRHKHVLRAFGLSPVAEKDASKQFLALEPLSQVLAAELPPPAHSASIFERRAGVKRWPMLRALRYGLQLALALQYIHDEAFTGYRLLHRDVKPKNIGIVGGRLVLFDFGVAKLVRRDAPSSHDGVQLTGMCGSLRYMAPEVASNKPYNQKADVYSFGVVLWEMVSHERPYDLMASQDFARRVCDNGERPPIKKAWHPVLRAVLEATFRNDFRERPEFEEILDDMQAVVAEVSHDPASGVTSGKSRRGSGSSGVALTGA
tara:strand:- start:123 stop:2375 length:2253 start_codon:yes stop_codon:yes gene_type:complete